VPLGLIGHGDAHATAAILPQARGVRDAGQIQKALSLSQPALSMHIQRGEKEFREKPIKL
jgi:hypothetical protein